MAAAAVGGTCCWPLSFLARWAEVEAEATVVAIQAVAGVVVDSADSVVVAVLGAAVQAEAGKHRSGKTTRHRIAIHWRE